MSQSLADQLATTALSGGNAGFIEDLYEQFLRDPSSLDPAWVSYFKGLPGSGGEIAHGPIRERLLARAQKPAAAPSQAAAVPSDGASAKQGAVSRLIQVYANRGHLIANLDPLGLSQRAKPYILELQYFGLSDADLDTEFSTGSRNHPVPYDIETNEDAPLLGSICDDETGNAVGRESDDLERAKHDQTL